MKTLKIIARYMLYGAIGTVMGLIVGTLIFRTMHYPVSQIPNSTKDPQCEEARFIKKYRELDHETEELNNAMVNMCDQANM